MVPLEHEFGWTRAAISGAIAVNIALFGLIGPFAASLMSRYGLRRIVLSALALLAGSVALSSTMRTQWQLTPFWGGLVGAGARGAPLLVPGTRVQPSFDPPRGVGAGNLFGAHTPRALPFPPVV